MPTGSAIALAPLLRHRWNIAILAELHRAAGAKFITIARRVGLSRGSLTASLKYLVSAGLVRRNSGYGHPLRPEYLLTGQGNEIASVCAEFDDYVDDAGVRDIAYRKWSLPVVLAIGEKRCRFNQLRESLPGVTPRALVLGLKALERAGWVERQVDDGYPPAASYALSAAGQPVLTLSQRLLQSAVARSNSS